MEISSEEIESTKVNDYVKTTSAGQKFFVFFSFNLLGVGDKSVSFCFP